MQIMDGVWLGSDDSVAYGGDSGLLQNTNFSVDIFPVSSKLNTSSQNRLILPNELMDLLGKIEGMNHLVSFHFIFIPSKSLNFFSSQIR